MKQMQYKRNIWQICQLNNVIFFRAKIPASTLYLPLITYPIPYTLGVSLDFLKILYIVFKKFFFKKAFKLFNRYFVRAILPYIFHFGDFGENIQLRVKLCSNFPPSIMV